MGARWLLKTETPDAGQLRRHRVHRAVETKPAQMRDFPIGADVIMTLVQPLARNVSTFLCWRARRDDGEHSGR